MENHKIIQHLTQVLKNSKILQQEPMKKHTSFQVGGNADIYIKAQQVEDIKYIVQFAKENKIQLTIIGNGSNMLVQDKGIRGIVLEIGLKHKKWEKQQEEFVVTVRSRF